MFPSARLSVDRLRRRRDDGCTAHSAAASAQIQWIGDRGDSGVRCELELTGAMLGLRMSWFAVRA
jgi:hypothetical protein